MSPLPRVSIVMPSFNEEHFIEACLASVQAQDYPRELIEILDADGRSTDHTREILAHITEADPRIQMIDNPARLQAAGLGLAVKVATGDVIVQGSVTMNGRGFRSHTRTCAVKPLDAHGYPPARA